MERLLLAHLAKNTIKVASGEMERTLFGLICQGKGINLRKLFYFLKHF